MLTANNVSYKTNSRVLFNNLSFKLQAGEAIQLRGANGAGKTTLLKICAGLLTPARGEIRLELIDSPLYLPTGFNFASRLTVTESLAYFSYLQGLACSEEEQHSVLSRTSLLPARNSQIIELSSGMRSRLALATLLLSKAKLWLLDEPAANLDTDGLDLLQSICCQHLSRGGALCLVSHQQSLQVPASIIQLGAS